MAKIGYPFLAYLVYSILNSTFKYFECTNDVISICGREKYLNLEIESCNFVNNFLRFWPLEPHFHITLFFCKEKHVVKM